MPTYHVIQPVRTRAVLARLNFELAEFIFFWMLTLGKFRDAGLDTKESIEGSA